MGPSIGMEINNLSHRTVGTLLSFAIFANFDIKKKLKVFAMACDQDLTCLIFCLIEMGMFSSQKYSKCSVGTLMFDGFSRSILDAKIISQWEHHIYLRLLLIK